jgi:hypothetical protein
VAQGTSEEDRERGTRGLSVRAASWLAWLLAGLSVALFVAAATLYALARSAPVPDSWDVNFNIAGLLGSATFLAFPGVGTLIASRQPRNPVGWILIADGLLWTTTDMLDNYSVYGMASPGSVPFPLGAAAINNWLWVPSVGLLATYVFLLFPNGSLPSRRWRPLAWLSGVVIVLVSVGVALSPGPLQGLGGVQNPFGLLMPWTMPAFWATLLLLPLCMLASALSLVFRYRRSRGEQRQQLKWIAFAAAFVGLSYMFSMVLSFVFPAKSWFAPGSPLWLDLVAYEALLSFVAIPIAVNFAILKYRLYEIDLIINRTLVYGSLTATLALIYFGGVVGLQYVLRALTGQGSTLAVVASTLAIAALFNPLRRRVQTLVDRRFYRRKYRRSPRRGGHRPRAAPRRGRRGSRGCGWSCSGRGSRRLSRPSSRRRGARRRWTGA